jgi:hypothetical protein
MPGAGGLAGWTGLRKGSSVWVPGTTWENAEVTVRAAPQPIKEINCLVVGDIIFSLIQS